MKVNILRKFKGVQYLLTPLICALVTLAVAYQFALIDPEFHHDGIVLQPGIDLYEGRIPFRDSYQQYGLGEPFLSWLAVSFFGKNILAVRKLTVVFYSIIAFMLCIVWRRLIPGWLTAITCLLWLFMSQYFVWQFLPWASVHAILFQMLSIWCIVRFIEEGLTKYLFWGGLFCGGVWLCRWTVGIPLFASIGFFLVIIAIGGSWRNGSERNAIGIWRQLLLLSLGFVTVLVPSFLFLVFTSGVQDFFIQMMASQLNHFGVWRVTGGPLIQLPFHVFFRGGIPWRYVSLICVLMFLRGLYQFLALTYINYQPSPSDRISFLLATTGLASLLQYYPHPDWSHCFWASTPVFGLLSYAVWHQFVYIQRKTACVATLSVLFLIFGDSAVIQIHKAWVRLLTFDTRIEKPEVLRGMKTTAHQAAELEKLVHKMNELETLNPEKKVIVTHPDAVWNVLPKNPYRFHKLYVRWDVLCKLYPDYQQMLNDVIRCEEPILLTSPFFSSAGGSFSMPEGYIEVFRTGFRDKDEVVLAVPKK